MSARYKLRSARRLSKKAKRRFIFTLVLSLLLIFATVTWVLPAFINGLSFVTNLVKPNSPTISKSIKTSLAPPVLNIPFEATNTGQINIKGYATPKSKVAIFVDEKQAGETDSLDDGSVELKNISLNLGSNLIFGKTKEGNMESLPSKTIKVFYDSEKPTLEIYEPGDNTEVQGDKKIKVSGKTEAQAKVFVNDIQAIINSDGTFSLDYPLNEGENILTIKAEDEAKNLTEIQRRVIFK